MEHSHSIASHHVLPWSENVKPIEMWEISESGVIKVPKSMWVCESPMCMHKWSRCRDPIETTAVMSRYLN